MTELKRGDRVRCTSSTVVHELGADLVVHQVLVQGDGRAMLHFTDGTGARAEHFELVQAALPPG